MAMRLTHNKLSATKAQHCAAQELCPPFITILLAKLALCCTQNVHCIASLQRGRKTC